MHIIFKILLVVIALAIYSTTIVLLPDRSKDIISLKVCNFSKSDCTAQTKDNCTCNSLSYTEYTSNSNKYLVIKLKDECYINLTLDLFCTYYMQLLEINYESFKYNPSIGILIFGNFVILFFSHYMFK